MKKKTVNNVIFKYFLQQRRLRRRTGDLNSTYNLIEFYSFKKSIHIYIYIYRKKKEKLIKMEKQNVCCLNPTRIEVEEQQKQNL
jgi:hypothetical protein